MTSTKLFSYEDVHYEDVHHVAKAEFYLSLEDGQRYYLIDEVSNTDRSIEYWKRYIKGKKDAPELIGANPKLLANFQVYVNRMVLGLVRNDRDCSFDRYNRFLDHNWIDPKWDIRNYNPIFDEEWNLPQY